MYNSFFRHLCPKNSFIWSFFKHVYLYKSFRSCRSAESAKMRERRSWSENSPNHSDKNESFSTLVVKFSQWAEVGKRKESKRKQRFSKGPSWSFSVDVFLFCFKAVKTQCWVSFWELADVSALFPLYSLPRNWASFHHWYLLAILTSEILTPCTIYCRKKYFGDLILIRKS